MPTVSAVIPTFNRSEFVLTALESVLAQIYRDMEILIIDDGSTDGTEPRLRERMAGESEVPIRYMKTSNQGVAAARNTGVENAAGRWIAFLDSDDRWMPDKIRRQMCFIHKNPGIRLVHTQERWFRHGRRVNPPTAYRKYSGDVFLHCLPLCMIGPSSVLAERSLVREIGGFDEAYPVCEDYDLWLRISSLHRVGLIEEELTWKYGGHADQLSTSLVGIDYWRIKSLCRILRIRNLSAFQVNAVHKEIDRKADILLAGYRKHGRTKEYARVSAMIDKARLWSFGSIPNGCTPDFNTSR